MAIKQVILTIHDGDKGCVFALPEDTPILTLLAFELLVQYLNQTIVRLKEVEDRLNRIKIEYGA